MAEHQTTNGEMSPEEMQALSMKPVADVTAKPLKRAIDFKELMHVVSRHPMQTPDGNFLKNVMCRLIGAMAKSDANIEIDREPEAPQFAQTPGLMPYAGPSHAGSLVVPAGMSTHQRVETVNQPGVAAGGMTRVEVVDPGNPTPPALPAAPTPTIGMIPTPEQFVGMGAKMLISQISGIDDKVLLTGISQAETAGKGRTTVLAAIEKRLGAL